MSRQTAYEKPKLTFVSLQNSQSVADPCWANAVDYGTLYFDSEGKGYCSFTVNISGGNCGKGSSLTVDNFYYYDSTNPAGVPATADQSAKWLAELESKQVFHPNFAGNGTVVTPTPSPTWS